MARTTMGNVVEDLTNLSLEKQEEYAQTFCEGNDELKKLLLKMWKNGIQTYASCAGHKPEEMKSVNGIIADPSPYIYFEVVKLNEKQQQKLFKNLIMISKNLDIVKQFDLTLDNFMGFEKHGFRIMLKNSEYSYRVLNDLFDDVLKKETVIDKVKKFLIKKDKNDGLSEREKEFVNSLIDLNKVELTEYQTAVSDLPADQKIDMMRLEYEKHKGMFVTCYDMVKSSACVVSNEMGNYWVQVAEGMYSKNPHEEGIFYTLENGELKTLNQNQLEGLQEFTHDRKLNLSDHYTSERFNQVQNEINNGLSARKSSEI